MNTYTYQGIGGRSGRTLEEKVIEARMGGGPQPPIYIINLKAQLDRIEANQKIIMEKLK